MRTLLSTVARGLRSRALLSGGSVLLIALAIGSAVLGPQFSSAVTNSFLVTRLAQAPAALTGLSWTFEPPASGDHGAASMVARARDAADAATPVRAGATGFDATTHGILTSDRVASLGAEWRYLAVTDGCAHLEITGRCPEKVGEALILEGDAEKTDFEPGRVLALPGLPSATIVGTYQAPDVDEEDFWFAPLRFASTPPSLPPASSPYQPAPLVTVPETFDELESDEFTVTVDRLLHVTPTLGGDDLPELVDQARVMGAPGASVPDGGTLTPESINALGAIAAEVRSQQSTARASIAPAVISVVLVALALLLRLLTAAADLRMPELALASLRGVPRRRMWQLGLSEPFALLATAVPLGLLAGVGFAYVLLKAWLVPGLPLPLPWTALVAGLLVALGAAAVAVVAVGLVLRLPLTDQLTGVRRPRPAGRGSLVAQLALVAAAVAVLVSKLSASGPGDPDVTDLALPVLLALVGGLVATRVIVLLARWWTRRRGRSLPGYVAARAISRRQEGTLVILPVTAAIAICVFGAGVYDSAGQWRESVAATAAPAPVLWTSNELVSTTVDLTHAIDPDGRWLMAASTLSSAGPTYAVLDTPRLARVGSWQGQWTPGTGPEEISRLLSPQAVQPTVTGTSVSLTVDRDTDAGDELYVRLRLSGTGGDTSESAYLGPYPVGVSTATAEIPCAGGCTVETITLGRQAVQPLTITGDVTLSDLTVDGAPVDGAFRVAGWRVPADASGRDSITGVRTDGDDLVVGLDAATPVIAQLTSGDVPDRLPVIAGVDAVTVPPDTKFDTSAIAVRLDPVLRARSVPLLGPVGVLIDYRMFSTGRTLYDQGTDVYVLARADAPTSVTDQLRQNGLTVSTTLAEQERVLDNSAYALALRLYAVVAGLVLLMALAGLFVSTAVQLPARRRDAAALRVVGVPRRTVASAVLREVGLMLGATAAAGLAAGSLAQYVVLRTVTLGFAEDIRTPALVAAIDPVRLVVLAVLAVVLFGTVAALSALLTVRGARGATLRESAR